MTEYGYSPVSPINSRPDIRVEVETIAFHEIGHAFAALEAGVDFWSVILGCVNPSSPAGCTLDPQLTTKPSGDKLMENDAAVKLAVALAGPAVEVAVQICRVAPVGELFPLGLYFESQKQPQKGWEGDIRHAKEALRVAQRPDDDKVIIELIEQAAGKYPADCLERWQSIVRRLVVRGKLPYDEVKAFYESLHSNVVNPPL